MVEDISLNLVNSRDGVADHTTFKTSDTIQRIVKYIQEKYKLEDNPITLYVLVGSTGENEPLAPEIRIGEKLHNGDTVYWTDEQVWGKHVSDALATFGRHAFMLKKVYNDWNFADHNVPARGIYKYCVLLGKNTKHRVIILPSSSYPISPPAAFIDPAIDHPCVREDGTVHIHGEDNNIVWRKIRKSENPLITLVQAFREQFKLW